MIVRSDVVRELLLGLCLDLGLCRQGLRLLVSKLLVVFVWFGPVHLARSAYAGGLQCQWVQLIFRFRETPGWQRGLRWRWQRRLHLWRRRWR